MLQVLSRGNPINNTFGGARLSSSGRSREISCKSKFQVFVWRSIENLTCESTSPTIPTLLSNECKDVMRAWCVLFAVAVAFQNRSQAAGDSVSSLDQLQDPRVSAIDSHSTSRKLRRNGVDDDTADNSEERGVNAAATAAMHAKMEKIKVKMMFKDWFQGGKTLEQVRTLLSLPAKGEAVTHANWAMYLKYLKFYEKQQKYAADMAKVDAIKQKIVYKNWLLDRKTTRQVRQSLGLPETGTAVGYANWDTFLGYLKFQKEYVKQYGRTY